MNEVCDPDTATGLRLDLISAEKVLARAQREFLDQLRREREYECWVWNGSAFIAGAAGREFAIQVIGKLFYEPGQDSRAALTCPGLLACSPTAMALAGELNSARESFTNLLRVMDQHLVPVRDRDSEGTLIDAREPLSKVALAAIGYSHLHRKYVTRKLTILASRPDYVGMSWAHTQKVERLSKDQVRKRLGAMVSGPGVDRDLLKLDELPDWEPLAVVRQFHVHVRANLVWRGRRPGEKDVKRQCASRLPLLVPSEPGEALPERAGMRNERERKSQKRVLGRKIEDVMYMPSVHAHRYMPQFRRRPAG